MNAKSFLNHMINELPYFIDTTWHKFFMWFSGTSVALNIGKAAEDYTPSFISIVIDYIYNFPFIPFFSGLAVILLVIERGLLAYIRYQRI